MAEEEGLEPPRPVRSQRISGARPVGQNSDYSSVEIVNTRTMSLFSGCRHLARPLWCGVIADVVSLPTHRYAGSVLQCFLSSSLWTTAAVP